MVHKLKEWQAAHPGVSIDGDGRWLAWKPCINRARRFDSYFAAHKAALSHEKCQCDGSHFIIELEGPPIQRSARELGYRR